MEIYHPSLAKRGIRSSLTLQKIDKKQPLVD
ncbi:hypothetical protein MHA_1951 [Mannheimia haemolytica PHL213]|nr:hypothetical protein MHA_1951 [Mannheimia haemolytica PHL213]